MPKTEIMYEKVEVDLGIARSDTPLNIGGSFLAIQYLDGRLDAKFDSKDASTVSLNLLRFVIADFENIYLTNPKQKGRKAILLIGKVAKFWAGLKEDILLAELATRLGSIVTYDRKGEVIFCDDFEDGIDAWRAIATGTGAGVENSTESVKTKAFSVKLTTGDAIGNDAQIRRFFTIPKITRLGLEVSFTLNDDLEYVAFQIVADPDNLARQGTIRYYPAEDALRYIDKDANYQNIITGLALYANDKCFHTIKFVIDLDKNEYVRVLLNEQEYDLSGKKLYTYSTTGAMTAEVAIIARTAVATNVSVYVDDVIVTQNEL